jgi:hypothetical protein
LKTVPLGRCVADLLRNLELARGRIAAWGVSAIANIDVGHGIHRHRSPFIEHDEALARHALDDAMAGVLWLRTIALKNSTVTANRLGAAGED